MNPSSHLGQEFPIGELMTRFTEEWNKRREETDKPVTRIASFNLLVVSRGDCEEGLQEVLQGLAKSHPSRTIWCKVDGGREWSNSTGRLHLGCGSHGDQVCSEQIQICCSNEPQRVSSLLLPLIRSGLPTHLLWWHAGPPEGDLFDRLADRCQLVLLADSNWSELCEVLPSLWEDRMKTEHSFYPLSWFRLTKARQQIAAAYGRSEVELALPKDIGAPGAFADLLTLWLRSLLPERDFQSGAVRIVSSAEAKVPTVNWKDRQDPLKIQSNLDAVREALDRPYRDPVFSGIVHKIKER
ncbi:MAG TPA: hypothetical protein EYO33_07480 [Phycisphaerales bacterium]|nr:hypothetical protein [Phycisphaerales bacterium]